MDINEIKQFLSENKDNEEVVNALGEVLPKPEPTVKDIEDYDEYFQSNEKASKWLQSVTDSKVTKGIETFKANNLDKIIEQELAKRSGESLTPEQIKLQEMEKQIEALKQEKINETLKVKSTNLLNDNGLSIELTPYVMGEDEETIAKKVNHIRDIINKQVEEELSNRLKGNTPKAPKGGDANVITKDQFNKMGYSERVKLANENPELYKKLMSN